MELSDPFDPNNWDLTPPERRVYADDAGLKGYAVVDEEDWAWAIQWRWCPNVKKSRRDPDRIKVYLHRAVGENRDGVRLRTSSLYLHVEIMRRTGRLPPSSAHVICDHRDGDTWNLRRSNLRWATHSMNSRNLFGSEPNDLEELMHG